MTRAEYNAYTTAYNELLELLAQIDDLEALLSAIDGKTLTSVQVSWGTGKDSIDSRLSGIKTDLVASIQDEITAVKSAVDAKRSAILALDATQPGSDAGLPNYSS